MTVQTFSHEAFVHNDTETIPEEVGSQRRAEVTQRLLTAAAESRGVERQRLQDEVVLLNLGLARSIARRYSGRGEEREDLVQVANVGLIKAVRRFDPIKGEGFLAFAVPTITGEIKRHFRDHAWMVRPPRRIQELQAEIPSASAELSQSLGLAPRPTEIAERLGADLEDVIEALASRGCFTPTSIDNQSKDGEVAPLVDLIGDDDPNFNRAEALALVGPVCRQLPERDQRILYLRFIRGWTQREIADDLGVTQMQVSRLLAGIFARIRTSLGIPEPQEPRPRRARRQPSAAAT